MGVVVSVGSGVGTMSQMTSFDGVRLDLSFNLPTSGFVISGGLVFLGFSSKSASGQARLGGSACALSSWTSQFSLTCRCGRGAGEGHRYVITSYSLLSSLSSALTFDMAAVSSIAINDQFLDPTLGGYHVVLFGSSFGHVDSSVKGRVGGSSSESTFWQSHSSVSCAIPTGILGVILPVALTISVRMSTLSLVF
eukprot:2573959-Rhodomonas_salina.1